MRHHESLGHTHPNSPDIGDIVKCTVKERKLKDSGGYRVEGIGWSNGSGLHYGYFAARGVKEGGLYQFSVEEYEIINKIKV